MAKRIIRIVSCAGDGSLRSRDYESLDTVMEYFEQIGVDDCSTELSLRGYPLFRGLVGPIAEGRHVARYESPDVFELMTREWTQERTRRKRPERAIPPVHFPLLDSVVMTDVVLPS
ncbi:MAG TPA: hypothetical protein PKD54_00195 [Pirellulaceae bacterium]|nr:hypothetical protein [Pirellulaceae bacterium]